ncbi:transcriptional repressor [Streptomyces sp. DH-12]|nr:transcriptional repressor [Streptomyces sp. DH-12]
MTPARVALLGTVRRRGRRGVGTVAAGPHAPRAAGPVRRLAPAGGASLHEGRAGDDRAAGEPPCRTASVGHGLEADGAEAVPRGPRPGSPTSRSA